MIVTSARQWTSKRGNAAGVDNIAIATLADDLDVAVALLRRYEPVMVSNALATDCAAFLALHPEAGQAKAP